MKYKDIEIDQWLQYKGWIWYVCGQVVSKCNGWVKVRAYETSAIYSLRAKNLTP